MAPKSQGEAQFNQRLREFLAREFGDVRHRRQLLVDMTGLEHRLGIADAIEFERLHDIPRSRIDQLEDDTWIELSRPHLLRLLTLEESVRRDDANFRFLRVVRDPIWETFDRPAIGFTGADRKGFEVATDLHLLSAFASAGVTLERPNVVDITEAMKTKNCICLGSPKCNRWTQAAIEALWPADTPPVRFYWPDWTDGREQDRVSKHGNRRIDFIDHKGERDEAIDASPNRPVGILIVCRSPLGTTESVTTVIAAGCTKFGTLQIVEDVLSGGVYVWTSQLVPGQPSIFILKPRSRGKRWYNIDGERALIEKRNQRRALRNAQQ